MIMKRLTAEQFIAKIREADSWTLSRDNLIYEFELTVRTKNGEIEGYLGPNPFEGSLDDLMMFMFRVEELTRPTKSDVNLSLPTLDTKAFFEKINSSEQWFTNIHEPEGIVELVVFTKSATIQRYLSEDLRTMTADDAGEFLTLLGRTTKEKRNAQAAASDR